MNSLFKKSLFATSVLSLSMAAPAALAQESTTVDASDIVVTARRVEERLQDVPISITVLNQEQLSNANIVNAGDLATTTPGLMANQRFGADNTSFSLRGFTQELRTAPSVGVYFADVVAPRGGTPTTSGDGAGPGAFFDLQNVQILKGPQGTLFGRNTTGGAVLLVPQRPTDEFGGYAEASAGDFGMERLQGVLNAPLGDDARLRIGIDQQSRDGYLRNQSGIGPDRLADVDYIAGRVSLVADLTPNLENYTIVSYTHSENNGSVSQWFACNPGNPAAGALLKQMCVNSVGDTDIDDDYHNVQSSIYNPSSEIQQYQVINTTTWDATDNLTIKNIMSLSNLESILRGNVFGSNLQVGDITTGYTGFPFATPDSNYPYIAAMSGTVPGVPTVNQDSFSEELQFQGSAFSDRLQWQAGVYYEHSTPNGDTAGQGASNLLCDVSTLNSADPADFRCADTNYVVANNSPFFPPSRYNLVRGIAGRNTGWTEFENRAVYAQATYDITEQFSVTGGIRYTWDQTHGETRNVIWYFNDPLNVAPADAGDPYATGGYTSVDCADPNLPAPSGDGTDPDDCRVRLRQESEAPTWVLDFDYKPTEDLLFYVKWARGYRQGSVNISGTAGGYTSEPEHVDTYEIGAKTNFDGPFPGIFNIAAYYNDFRDQQVQLGLQPVGGVGTTAIVNAGATTIWGFEADLNVELLEGLNWSVSYAYLHSNVDQIEPQIVVGAPSLACPTGQTFNGVCLLGGTLFATQDKPLTFSPEHTVSTTLSYRLPLPENIGEITLAGTYSWTDDYLAAQQVSTPYAIIPAYELVNLNLNWDRIGGSHVDASLFATNVFDETYSTFVGGQYNSSGFEYRQLGQPRMIGARLRYNFGS